MAHVSNQKIWEKSHSYFIFFIYRCSSITTLLYGAVTSKFPHIDGLVGVENAMWGRHYTFRGVDQYGNSFELTLKFLIYSPSTHLVKDPEVIQYIIGCMSGVEAARETQSEELVEEPIQGKGKGREQGIVGWPHEQESKKRKLTELPE
jgi:hypothetical protein